MELEIKHYVSYLEHKVRVQNLDFKIDDVNIEFNIITQLYLPFLNPKTKKEDWHYKTNDGNVASIKKGRLVLRPLISSNDIDNHFKPLFKKGDKEVQKWLDSDYLYECGIDIEDIPYLLPERLPKGLFDLLVKHHFDVYHLIEEKKAISYTDI